MKYKKILAMALCTAMLSGTAMTASADMKYEAGLPAQSDSTDSLVEVLPPMSELPAFPGAEGYAAYITGGRGGKVIHVTNLNSSGEGSLAAAMENGGKTDEPRIIVFDVAGSIDIGGKVLYKKTYKNVTIAGQTAPGAGITLTGESFYLSHSENIIIRYVHFRHGQATAKDDSFFAENCKNIMIDHCSFAYGSDEVCSARWTNNMTIQWSIVTSGVRTHSMGGLQEWSTASIHHSLWGNQNDRNPKAKGIMDWTNNVLYNWGEYPYVAGGNSGGQGWGNVVNNYYIAGLDTKNPYRTVVRSNGKYMIYMGGNVLDSNQNGVLDGVNTGIDMIGPASSDTKYPERYTFPYDSSLPIVLIKNRMEMKLTDDIPLYQSIDTAEEAYSKVLEFAGAAVYHNQDGTTRLGHDVIDTEIIQGVRNQTGKILIDNAESYDAEGNHFTQEYLNNLERIDVNDANSPWYRPDTDQDGIPDAWETAHGLDPNNAEDGNGTAPSGYTWIEEYLNELAAPGFPGEDYNTDTILNEDAGKTVRQYKLVLENYNGERKEYEGIHGENQVMVPMLPIAEYLGYKILGVTENVITLEYPYVPASGNGLNVDVKPGVITIKVGEVGNKFSGGINPNEVPRVYNGMIYIPVNLISLGMGAVYDQTVGTDNTGIITVQDAEVYKQWHNDSIRNERKASAPAMTVLYTDKGFKIVFDKETACADGDAVLTLTAGGKEYTVKARTANIWGSNKVASLNYTAFKDADGAALSEEGPDSFTLKIGAGAFRDAYKENLVNEETTIEVDIAAQKSEKAAAQQAAQALSDEVAATLGGYSGSSYVADNGAALSVGEAIKAIYRLLAMKEINAITSDQIFCQEIYQDTQDVASVDEGAAVEELDISEKLADAVREEKGWTTVGDLKNGITEELKTLANAIAEEMKNTEDIKGQEVKVDEEKLQVHVLKLTVKTIDADGNEGAPEPLTEENFPAGGLTVTLPYPEGINFDTAKDYRFAIKHLIGIKGPGSKNNVGDIVDETNYSCTSDGIEVTVMDACVMAVAPVYAPQTEADEPKPPVITPEEPGDDEDDDDDEDDAPIVETGDDKVSNPAKTGDHMTSFMWIVIAVLALAVAGGGVFFFLKFKKKDGEGKSGK